MRRGKTLLMTVITACMVIGCGQEKAPEMSSISISQEGIITHQIVGELEQDYYETEGVRRLAEDRVAEYCSEKGSAGISLESVEEADNAIVIKFSYQSGEDYEAFNHRDLFVGTVAQAKEKGYQVDNIAFVSAGNEPTEPGAINGLDAMSIVIVGTKPGEALMVNLSDKALYINQSVTSSANVAFNGKKSVCITNSAADGADEGIELSYIIY